MNNGGVKRNNQGRRGWIIIAGICGVACVCCLIWLICYMVGNRNAERELDDLRQEYATDASITEEGQTTEYTMEPETSPAPTEEPSPLLEYDIPNKTVDIKAMQENENEDIYAWIIVPGTVIDYPVVQDPEQLDYYLDHNSDRSSGYPGCIYSQYLNSTEWDDPNTVLYGHNMKNGSMFAGLHQYEDPQFLEENQYIYIFSENYVRVYHIFGAYEFDNRHLLLNMDMNDPVDFANYLVEVKGLKGMNVNFLEDVSVSIEDKLLTLETCIASKPDKRYIVQAVLEAEGDWPLESRDAAEE